MNYFRMYYTHLWFSKFEIILSWIFSVLLGLAEQIEYTNLQLIGISLLAIIIIYTIVFLYHLSQIKIMK